VHGLVYPVDLQYLFHVYISSVAVCLLHSVIVCCIHRLLADDCHCYMIPCIGAHLIYFIHTVTFHSFPSFLVLSGIFICALLSAVLLKLVVLCDLVSSNNVLQNA